MTDLTMVQFQTQRRAELARYASGDRIVEAPGTAIVVAKGRSTTSHLNLTKPLPHHPPAMCKCGGYIMADGRCTKCGTLTPGWKR